MLKLNEARSKLDRPDQWAYVTWYTILTENNRRCNFEPIKESFVFRTEIMIKLLYYSLLRITSTDISSIQASHWSRKISKYPYNSYPRNIKHSYIPDSFKVTILRYTKYTWAISEYFFNQYIYTRNKLVYRTRMGRASNNNPMLMSGGSSFLCLTLRSRLFPMAIVTKLTALARMPG